MKKKADTARLPEPDTARLPEPATLDYNKAYIDLMVANREKYLANIHWRRFYGVSDE